MKKILPSILLLILTFVGMGGCAKKESPPPPAQQPSLPRLLGVTAMKDKGAKDVEEVNAFFDRPVDIKELKLLSRDGQQFVGDVYHSVFDMAAVLKPKDPSQFKERLPIRVRWKVVDKLGRQAEGDNVWLLEIKEHSTATSTEAK